MYKDKDACKDCKYLNLTELRYNQRTIMVMLLVVITILVYIISITNIQKYIGG